MAFPPKISTGDLSALLGVTERAITRLVAQNVLRKDGIGTFDTVDAVQGFIQHREAVVAERFGKGAFGEARAELYIERGRITRIQRQALEGTLGPLAECRAAWATIFTAMRAGMYANASRVAPRIVGLKSAAQAKVILVAALNELMADIQSMSLNSQWTSDEKDTKPRKASHS